MTISTPRLNLKNLRERQQHEGRLPCQKPRRTPTSNIASYADPSTHGFMAMMMPPTSDTLSVSLPQPNPVIFAHIRQPQTS